jgi:hypothetical protein
MAIGLPSSITYAIAMAAIIITLVLASLITPTIVLESMSILFQFPPHSSYYWNL